MGSSTRVSCVSLTPHDSPKPTGTHPDLTGALKRLRKGSRATRYHRCHHTHCKSHADVLIHSNVNRTTDPDAAGLAAILDALNNLRCSPFLSLPFPMFQPHDGRS